MKTIKACLTKRHTKFVNAASSSCNHFLNSREVVAYKDFDCVFDTKD